jgi:group I intron endonuclease
MTSGVYSITNTVSGKRYIGSSQKIATRWRIHRNDLRNGKHHSRHLQHAWNLDGEDAFVFEILLECGVDDLLREEQRLMDERRAREGNHGYNTAPVAGSRRGVPHSPEVRARMSEKARARPPMKDEHRKALSAALRKARSEGRLFTDEHRRKISESLTGRQYSDETRAKIGAAGRGRPVSDETKEKLRAALKGKPLSDENYQRLLERSRTTNVITPEIRAKMVESRKATLAARRKEVAAQIIALKEEGLSFSKIAKRLTEDKVPTLNSRKEGAEPSYNWFPAIVIKIYNEATP